MGADQLEDFLINSKLVEWQRQAVRDAKDKTTEYRKQYEPFKIAHAREATQDFFLHYRKNAIFIRDSIKQRFEALDELILSALSEHTINFQTQSREFTSIDRLPKEGMKMVKAAEVEVQKILWDAPRQQID
jgi:hypothetical protein